MRPRPVETAEAFGNALGAPLVITSRVVQSAARGAAVTAFGVGAGRAVHFEVTVFAGGSHCRTVTGSAFLALLRIARTT